MSAHTRSPHDQLLTAVPVIEHDRPPGLSHLWRLLTAAAVTANRRKVRKARRRSRRPVTLPRHIPVRAAPPNRQLTSAHTAPAVCLAAAWGPWRPAWRPGRHRSRPPGLLTRDTPAGRQPGPLAPEPAGASGPGQPRLDRAAFTRRLRAQTFGPRLAIACRPPGIHLAGRRQAQGGPGSAGRAVRPPNWPKNCAAACWTASDQVG